MTDEEYRAAFKGGLQAAWDAVDAIIQRGLLPGYQRDQRNGEIMASNEIMNLITRIDTETTV